MNASAELTAVDRAKADLSKRLNQELSNLDSDPQAAVIQLIQAEKTLESYLTAVNNNLESLPERQAIAWSCFVLLVIGDDFNDDDYNSIARLYATDIPLSLHQIAPDIEKMRDRIIRKWEHRLDDNTPPDKPVYVNSPF
jgi:hypothetical protein